MFSTPANTTTSLLKDAVSFKFKFLLIHIQQRKSECKLWYIHIDVLNYMHFYLYLYYIITMIINKKVKNPCLLAISVTGGTFFQFIKDVLYTQKPSTYSKIEDIHFLGKCKSSNFILIFSLTDNWHELDKRR